MKETSWQWVFEATGSRWVIDIYNPSKNTNESLLFDETRKRINKFEADYSRFRSDSLITRMSKMAGVYELPKDAEKMFDLYKKIYKITNGKFTPLIGQIMEQSGYDSQYSFIPKELKPPPIWDGLFQYKFPKIKLKQPALFDFGAGGKGYLVDIISLTFKEKGIKRFTVDAGGDIYYRNTGDEPLSIGLENPQNKEEAIGIVKIRNESICGSSGSRRKWGNFHHVIDPHTLKSPTNVLATWVIAKESLLADCLATCLFLVPEKILRDEFDFEYLILNDDFSIKKSKGFRAKLFTK